jgi:hypothetical protein
MMRAMRTIIQLQRALLRTPNLSEFARRHRLSERTLHRIRAGANVRAGTVALVDAALSRDKLLHQEKRPQ